MNPTTRTTSRHGLDDPSGRFGGPFAFDTMDTRGAMTVQVLLFARFAEILGADRIALQLPRPATLQSVLDRLRAMPGGDALPARPLLARNQAQAPADALLEDGDEVAVLPPLAGG
jgi:molybdopterin converting factor small subunit